MYEGEQAIDIKAPPYNAKPTVSMMMPLLLFKL